MRGHPFDQVKISQNGAFTIYSPVQEPVTKGHPSCRENVMGY